jgi:hypothetical protein
MHILFKNVFKHTCNSDLYTFLKFKNIFTGSCCHYYFCVSHLGGSRVDGSNRNQSNRRDGRPQRSHDRLREEVERREGASGVSQSGPMLLGNIGITKK